MSDFSTKNTDAWFASTINALWNDLLTLWNDSAVTWDAINFGDKWRDKSTDTWYTKN